MKKNIITVFALLLTTTLLLSVTNTTAQVEAAGEVVSIPDANLAAAIREALELPPGAAITSDAMRNLTELHARGRGIANLTGLEYAVNLTELDLGYSWVNDELHQNPISNVSPLASLTNLEELDLASTGVSDVSALARLTNLEELRLLNTGVSDISLLARLTNLEELDLYGTGVSDVSSLASLTNLKWLHLGWTGVSDVSLLARLTNLERLYLDGTGVSDVSSLARLTNLEWLYLGWTGVSDVSSLASLTNLERLGLQRTDVSDVSSLASLTNLEELDLRGCPLNAAAYQTHIPAIQANGTEVAFDPFKPIHLPGVPWLVSLIYFRPSDRPVRPNVDAEIDRLIKEAQRFFADEMERHGFGRKTFQFEADANGNAVVHHVNGKFPYAHYQQNLSWDEEINEQVYIPGNRITAIMIDIGGEEKLPAGVCGHGGGFPHYGGSADIYCWDWSLIAHELGHAFGMTYHDHRDRSLMSYQGFDGSLSPCFAAWLDVHPAFNPTVVRRNTRATIQMLSATLAAPPNAIRLRFTVTAPAGSLYQARLLTPEKKVLDGYAFNSGGLIGCKRIDGNPTSKTVEFVTALTPDTESVSLQIISIDGNSVDGSFPIDVASLLPPAKVVSIPDPNLAAAVRESLNMSSGETFTTHSILNLVELDARNRGIKDLTGLEHAVNLKEVDLGAEYINGEGYVNSNAISDLSPLSDLTNLEVLSLGEHITLNRDFLRELPPLAPVSIPDPNLAAAIRAELLLTSNETFTTHSILNLVKLEARNAGIKSLTGLEHAVNLKEVDLGAEYINGEGYVNSNAISDLSPLSDLTNLEVLSLGEHITLNRDFLRELPPLAPVSIPDPNLAAAIRAELLLTSNETFTTHSILSLVKLEARNRGIKSLTGLEHAVNLKEVDLGEEYISDEGYVNSNAISDFSPLEKLTALDELNLEGMSGLRNVSALARLTNLEELDLASTGVSDVSALARLTHLERLYLTDTAVSDVSSLASLTNLETLYLHGTAISDVSSLAGLTNLKRLYLRYTAVSDVSSLASLTNLETLGLSDTAVSDVSALASLTNLEWLGLLDTAISDVSALAHLTNLETLDLGLTDVSDVSALAGLINLERLYLTFTAVSDVSALAHLTNLETLDLQYTDVSDVSPLLGLSLSGTSWDSIGLYLAGCPLSYASIHTYIPALQVKGIEVLFDNVAHPALLKVSGDRQEGAGATALPNPFVVEAMDERGEPMVGRIVQFDILEGGGSLNAKTVATDAQGNARVTLTLGSSQGVNKVKASSERIQSWVLFMAVATEAAPQLVADVNGDGVTNLADLAIVAQAMGKPVENPRADVNGDGVVDAEDFALVAARLGEGEAAAPSQAALPAGLTLEKGEWALNFLYAENTGSPAFRRGIAKLEGILALLVPDKTLLLANYPNPFNPETWIPYQLSEPAAVTVTIYAATGAVVRRLDLGHRRAGSYDSRHRAAYWDGRNVQGEPVASGVYFYTLSAGDFSATRKMVIRK